MTPMINHMTSMRATMRIFLPPETTRGPFSYPAASVSLAASPATAHTTVQTFAADGEGLAQPLDHPRARADPGIWEIDDQPWAHGRLTCVAGRGPADARDLRRKATAAQSATAERAAVADVLNRGRCLYPPPPRFAARVDAEDDQPGGDDDQQPGPQRRVRERSQGGIQAFGLLGLGLHTGHDQEDPGCGKDHATGDATDHAEPYDHLADLRTGLTELELGRKLALPR